MAALRAYLIDTRNLTQPERAKTEELINATCVPWSIIQPEMVVYIAGEKYLKQRG